MNSNTVATTAQTTPTTADVLDHLKRIQDEEDGRDMVYEVHAMTYYDPERTWSMDTKHICHSHEELCQKLFDLDMRGWFVVNLHEEKWTSMPSSILNFRRIVIEMEQSPEWQKTALQ